MRRPIRIVLLLLAIVGAAVLLVGVTSKLYRIPSSAMEPTLHCPRPDLGCRADEADRIVVSRVLYKMRDPKRGDIVAYRLPEAGAARCGSLPGATFIHRIAAVPGDRFALPGGTRTIPRDRYVVLGDNRTQSCDSRAWGLLPRDRIIGPRIATYWPVDRLSIG